MTEYDKMTNGEGVWSGIKIDKSYLICEDIKDKLWHLIQNSKYTINEVAEKLDWDIGRLKDALNDDKDISIYEIVHISGVLGYNFDISFDKIKGE